MLTTLLLLAVLFIFGFLNVFFAFSPNKFYGWVQSLFHETCSSLTSYVNSKSTQKISVKERSDSKTIELKMVFATFDKNGDGFITKQELMESLKNIRLLMTEKEVEEMVVKLDVNGDGLIDYDEFCNMCKAMDDGEESDPKRSGGEGDASEGEMLKEAFNVFDKDKDGLISMEELGSVLSSLGLKEGDKIEDCKAMIRNVDIDGDGMVNFDEFKAMMKDSGRLVSVSAF